MDVAEEVDVGGGAVQTPVLHQVLLEHGFKFVSLSHDYKLENRDMRCKRYGQIKSSAFIVV